MLYIREFELVPDAEGGYVAWPTWTEGATEGETYEEAAAMAADWMREKLRSDLAAGREVPQTVRGRATRGGELLAVAVETSLADVPCMSASEAARVLGVSTARVAQLCREGALDSWRVGSARMVSEESVEYRLASSPAPGRPKVSTEVLEA